MEGAYLGVTVVFTPTMRDRLPTRLQDFQRNSECPVVASAVSIYSACDGTEYLVPLPMTHFPLYPRKQIQ